MSLYTILLLKPAIIIPEYDITNEDYIYIYMSQQLIYMACHEKNTFKASNK